MNSWSSHYNYSSLIIKPLKREAMSCFWRILVHYCVLPFVGYCCKVFGGRWTSPCWSRLVLHIPHFTYIIKPFQLKHYRYSTHRINDDKMIKRTTFPSMMQMDIILASIVMWTAMLSCGFFFFVVGVVEVAAVVVLVVDVVDATLIEDRR